MKYIYVGLRILLVASFGASGISWATHISQGQIDQCKQSFPAYMRTLEHQIRWAERSLYILGERITVAAARRLYHRTATAAEITFASSFLSRHKNSARMRIIKTINSSDILNNFIQTLFELEPATHRWNEYEFKRIAHSHILRYLNLDPTVSFERFMELSSHRGYLSDETHELILAHAIFALHCFEQTRVQ